MGFEIYDKSWGSATDVAPVMCCDDALHDVALRDDALHDDALHHGELFFSLQLLTASTTSRKYPQSPNQNQIISLKDFGSQKIIFGCI